jgi:transposase-like protein
MSKRKKEAAEAAKRRRQRAVGSALQRNRAVEMLNSGVKRARIAEQMGVTPATITRWLKEAGIAPLKPVARFGAEGDEPEFSEFEPTYEEPDPEPVNEFQEVLMEEAEESLGDALVTARDEEEKGIIVAAENQAAPSDKYQAYVAANAIRLLRDSLPHIRGPRTVKELSELDQIIRRSLGLSAQGNTGKGSGSTLKIDISILNNTKADLSGTAVPQRTYEAEILDEDQADDES